MARNVYVTALEPGSGKSAVVLGLTEVLSRRAGRLASSGRSCLGGRPDTDIELVLGRFRLPEEYARSYALTADDLHAVAGRADYDELLKRVLNGYAAVADGATIPEPVPG